MVVAVQKGMENIKEQLRERGYEVVTFGEYNYPIDAVVYAGYGIDTSYIKNNNIPNLTSEMSVVGRQDRNYGVLMVNATNKSIGEIEYILKNRVYSPLF